MWVGVTSIALSLVIAYLTFVYVVYKDPSTRDEALEIVPGFSVPYLNYTYSAIQEADGLGAMEWISLIVVVALFVDGVIDIRKMATTTRLPIDTSFQTGVAGYAMQ